MAHPGYGHLWREEELSDCDIVLCVDRCTLEDSSPAVLRTIPGHKSILTASPFCKAQVLRWPSRGSDPYGLTSTVFADIPPKQQIRLTVQDASWEAAALTVLAVLYLAQPAAELLAALTQEQQVQAAVLGDMWDVPAATSTAVRLLSAPIDGSSSSDGLSEAALVQLTSMSAVPACLLSVLQSALVSKFGDLEAVWGNADLRKALLLLPLPAMEQLLSSDKLKVASEDTVLYTAQTYVDRLPAGSQEEAQGKLAPLVRCTYLSRFWLSASLLSDDAPKMLLSVLSRQLRHLFLAKHAAATGAGGLTLSTKDIKEAVEGAPASWLLQPRRSKPVSSVQLVWHVDVADIKQAVAEAISRRKKRILWSPASPPLHGVAWSLALACLWKDDRGGCIIGLFGFARDLPANTSINADHTMECVGHTAPSIHRQRPFRKKNGSSGPPDFFRCGTMSGGFDEAAWARKGLPLVGQIELRLTVK